MSDQYLKIFLQNMKIFYQIMIG